jgi:hypothetical protein
MELESEGYTPLEGSHRITAEMNPETGAIIHVRTIEMVKE